MTHFLAAPAGPPCFSTLLSFAAAGRRPKPTFLSSASSHATPKIFAAGVRHWTSEEIAGATAGEVVTWAPPGSISSDTRTLRPGQWFLAIAGENVDGHDLVGPELEGAGCVGIVGNRASAGWGRGFVRVAGDTLVALEKMAIYARSRYRGALVGLTGSVGKTTTRAMTALALQSLGRVHQTHANWNTRIGVALTLVDLPEDADFAVVELATKSKGKMLESARLARPTVRVILNVGYAHTEFFGGLREVAEAKGELMEEVMPGDICVVNADDPLVTGIPLPRGVQKIFFGRTLGCDVRLVHAEVVDGGCAVQVILENRISMRHEKIHHAENSREMVEFKIPSPGLHLAINACAAAAIAISLGASLHQVSDSLSRFSPVSQRSHMEIADNGIRVIDDTYNANPMSMAAAINLLKSLDCSGRRVLVLGDMWELGSHEAASHEAVLNMCCEACFDLVAVAGPCFTAVAEKLNVAGKIRFICKSDSESLVPRVAEMLSVGDTVLIKGGRQMEMEKIVLAVKMTSGRHTPLSPK